MLLTPKCRHTLNYTDVIFVLCPSIPTAFAHTWCISPSVCLLKSFMQASTFAPSPLAARASAIRSRTCGRQRLAFLAVSATGGARKPNPSEGGEGAPAPCTEFLLVRTKSRGWRGFSPRVGIFTKIYIKNSPPHSEKAQKESSGPFAVGYSEKTPGTAVQRTQAFPRPTANGSCGGSIPQNACFGTEWKG